MNCKLVITLFDTFKVNITDTITTILLDATNPLSAMNAITEAALLLHRGEVVAFPTETVYGLGADAYDADAVAKVFLAKGRPADNPLIVHVAQPDDVFEIGKHDRRAVHLAQRFMPGPLTLVLNSLPDIPAIVRAGLPTVAVRCPDHAIAASLISVTGPLVAPSANRSGKPSPTTARHVMNDLHGRIAAVLDGGACRIGIESTVVDCSSDRLTILRAGIITAEEIADATGEKVEIADHRVEEGPKAPGMKYRHYAPVVPVRLFLDGTTPDLIASQRYLILASDRWLDRFAGQDVRLLDERTFYAWLREADESGFDEVIIAASVEECAPGLLDRIRKAAGIH